MGTERTKDKWVNLNNPPVLLAIFQIRYHSTNKFPITEYHKLESVSQIRKEYPKRNDNYNSDILGIEGTPVVGVSTLKAKANTQINCTTYFTEDQKRKFILCEDSLTYTDENPYIGWNHFKENILKSLNFISEKFNEIQIDRISIRFVNKFNIPDINNLSEYFNVTLSTVRDVNLQYQITKYSFKYLNQIPDTDIHAIINQAVEVNGDNTGFYMLDIDVLSSVNLFCDLGIIATEIEKLRDIKNNIFFENITEKAIELCR